jgi:energy-coupling factor transporter ATP-binding protein EcfA2
LLVVSNLTKEYPTPNGALSILSGISISLKRGESAAIMGPSGSGKSSLLYILGALEPPTSGEVTLDDRDPFRLSERELFATDALAMLHEAASGALRDVDRVFHAAGRTSLRMPAADLYRINVDGTRNVDQLVADFKPVVSQMPGQNGSVTREIVVGHLETAAKLALLVG